MEPKRTRYTDAVLTLIAVLLAVLAIGRAGGVTQTAQAGSTPPGAQGQPGEEGRGGGLVSAAQQRKQIIAELRAMSGRIGKIEEQLKKGISVKVSEMPEIRIPRD